MENMKIYFCGSIRGGRERQALYAKMIELLKKYGTVLTEHVGDPTLTDKGGDGGNSFIYERDMAWLRECDIVIAECSSPSLGVGYELAMAETLGKKAHIFYGGEEGRLSAMLAGSPHFTVHEYSDEADALIALRNVMSSEICE